MNNHTRLILGFLLIAILFTGLTACGGNGSSNNQPTPTPAPTSVNQYIVDGAQAEFCRQHQGDLIGAISSCPKETETPPHP